MLYCHCEKFSLASQALVKLKFSGSPNLKNSYISFADKKHLQTCVTLLKQIPAGKRSYDPSTYIWTIPETNLEIVELYLNANGGAIIEWADLAAAMNPQTQKNKNWADSLRDAGKVKSESVEDFFKNAPGSSTTASAGALTTEALQQRLTLMIKPFVSFELEDRESFLRGYKIAARRLHPDLGGDAAKMSELNSLFMQYKEVMR